jgi:hypothetical protein
VNSKILNCFQGKIKVVVKDGPGAVAHNSRKYLLKTPMIGRKNGGKDSCIIAS